MQLGMTVRSRDKNLPVHLPVAAWIAKTSFASRQPDDARCGHFPPGGARSMIRLFYAWRGHRTAPWQRRFWNVAKANEIRCQWLTWIFWIISSTRRRSVCLTRHCFWFFRHYMTTCSMQLCCATALIGRFAACILFIHQKTSLSRFRVSQSDIDLFCISLLHPSLFCLSNMQLFGHSLLFTNPIP